jgi:hypothetical protein
VETPQQISARLNRDQQQALIRMAGIQAEMAVRKQSPKLVEQGLQSVVLGGGFLHPSYSLSTLAKLYHSALKLGMNPEVAFAEAAESAPSGALKTEMSRFPLREIEGQGSSSVQPARGDYRKRFWLQRDSRGA